MQKVWTQRLVNRRDNSKASKAPTSTQESEPSNKARKDKKKRHYKNKRDFKKSKDSSTPALGVNMAKINGSEQRKRNKKDLSGVTYFNYNKKGHFANKCPETSKN